MCKKIKLVLLWLALVVAVVLACYCWGMAIKTAFAEDDTWPCWVVCQPDSWVNIRSEPDLDGEVVGRVFAGQELVADAYTKSGWYHCIDLSIEAGEGWISMNYLADTAPQEIGGAVWTVEADGRVAVRESMGGSRKMWLQPGAEVEVHMVAGDWAVTSCGFIRVKYLQEVKDE